MSDFAKAMGDQKDLSLEEQKKAGAPIAGDMEEEYKAFLKGVIALLDEGAIDVTVPETLLKEEAFKALTEEAQDKVSVKLVNIADQIRLLEDFYRSQETPDTSPQLVTMIEGVWQITHAIEEEHGDILKF